ncbi:MAG: RNA polymerase sigma factor SigJ [Pseudomonadota bacterium]
MSMPPEDNAARIFTACRPALMGLAYRMLGERGEAEDVVQEAFLRWTRADAKTIAAPKAWLIRVTSRLCIDRLRALKRQRAAYDGPWLPEPWMAPDPWAILDKADTLADSLRLAFLLMLERLSPEERAAFLLRAAFDTPYGEIAALLERSQAACRQLVSRARKHLAAKGHAKPREHNASALLTAFVNACESGEAERLKAVLSADVELWADGGGKALAARNVLVGRARVAAFLIGIMRKRHADILIAPARVNNSPGFIFRDDSGLIAITALDLDAGGIRGIFVQRNPDKLAACGAV